MAVVQANGLGDRVTRLFGGVPASQYHEDMREVRQQASNMAELMQERMVDLELALEDVGWSEIGAHAQAMLGRAALRKITYQARMMYLKNPLINRAVSLQASYVFGQGVQVHAHDPLVQQAVENFWGDGRNQTALLGHAAQLQAEIDLELEGNIFLALFTDTTTGHVAVRRLPFDEIEEVVTNPDDAQEPWYYLRKWSTATSPLTMVQRPFGLAALPKLGEQKAYYPDWRYHPKESERLQAIGGTPIRWDTPVRHRKVGGLGGMLFGVPEVYAALDWALAYKRFLENWSTIADSLARFAYKLTVPGGRRGVEAAQGQLSTTLARAPSSTERNPAPVAGSVWVQSEGAGDLAPMPKTGAIMSAEDGRRLLLMVCAATGWQETFFGDVSVGTLATAKSLDRPTELRLRDRQTFWGEIFGGLTEYAVDQDALSAEGFLKGTIEELGGSDAKVIIQGVADRDVDHIFPPILEHDVEQGVKAVVSALTLDGKEPTGLLTDADLEIGRRTLMAMMANLVDLRQLDDAADPAGGAPTKTGGESGTGSSDPYAEGKGADPIDHDDEQEAYRIWRRYASEPDLLAAKPTPAPSPNGTQE